MSTTNPNRALIFEAIDGERDYQDQRWGNEMDDTENRPMDWTGYINAYAMKWFQGGFVPYAPQTVDEFRQSMIKVAAIAVGAVESIDRQREANGKTFYEEVE